MASFFDLPPEGGIAAGEMADVEPQSVGQYDASQGFATPEARQYRVGQQVQRVKAKNFFGQRGIPTIDNGETVRPVVDEAGAPLTNFSNTASTGWDSWGQPRQVVQRPDGGVDLADPYANAPVKVDKAGNRYRAPAGLEWQYDGVDEAAKKVATDRATAAASTALSSQAAQDARDAKAAAKDIKARQSDLETAIPGLATLENPNDARKAIDDHFNELYAAPEANETAGFFGSGEYTPAAQQIRAGIDQSKAQAYAAYDDLGARKQQALTLQQQAEVNNAKARELRRQVTATKLAKAEQDGAVIPQAPATPAAPAQEGAVAELPDDQVKQIIAKPEERISYLQEIGRGLARGSVNLTKSLGGFLRLMGAETVGNFLKEAGEYYEDDYKASKEAEGFAPQNPRWWAARLPEVVPQLAGQLGLAFLTRGRSVPAQIAAFAAPTLATTAGDVYSEAVEDRLKKGQSVEEARDGAIGEAALVGTLAAGLDMIPGGEFLSKTPVVRSLMGKAIRNSVLRKGVAGFVAEGGTEAAQSVVQDLAALGFRDDSERFKDAWQRYSSDFLLGGVLGGVADIAIGHPEATPPASEPAPQGQQPPQSPAPGQAVPSNNPPDAVSSPEAEAPAAPEQPISSPSVVEPGQQAQPASTTEPPVAPVEGLAVSNSQTRSETGDGNIPISNREASDPAAELAQAEQELEAADPRDPMYPLYEQSVETARARMLAAAKPIESQSPVAPQVEAQTSPEPVAAQERTPADATPVSGQAGGAENTLGVGEPVSDSGVSAPATIPAEQINAEAPPEPAPITTPSSAATVPTAVTPNQTAQPAATSAPSAREWGDIVPSDDIGATIETKDGRTGKVTAVAKNVVKFRTPDGKSTATTIVKARVVEAKAVQQEAPTPKADAGSLRAVRRGDYNEFSGEAAKEVGKTLGIPVTKRNGSEVVGVHVADTDAMKKLASSGKRVEVADEAGKTVESVEAKKKPETNAQRQKREEAELDADSLPAAATPAASPEAQQSRRLAQAALRLHESELRTLGHPVDIQIGETPNASGIYTTGKGRIVIDPEKLAKDTAKLTPSERLKKIKRAIAEEVTHVATLKYASENSDNYSRVQALANDAEWSKRAGEAYGPEWEGLSKFQKGAEIARMIIQGRGGKLTEASYRYLVDFMKWLRRKLKTLHPETRQVVNEIESRMGRYRAEQRKARAVDADGLGAASSENPRDKRERTASNPAMPEDNRAASKSGQPSPSGREARAAAEGTKITDANGEPLLVHHGSIGGAVPDRFNRRDIAFFTPDEQIAKGYAGDLGETASFYLLADNPLTVNGPDDILRILPRSLKQRHKDARYSWEVLRDKALPDLYEDSDVIAAIQDAGFDSLIIHDDLITRDGAQTLHGVPSYAVFEPDQIVRVSAPSISKKQSSEVKTEQTARVEPTHGYEVKKGKYGWDVLKNGVKLNGALYDEAKAINWARTHAAQNPESRASGDDALEPLFAASSEEQEGKGFFGKMRDRFTGGTLSPNDALLVGHIIPRTWRRLFNGGADTLKETASTKPLGEALDNYVDRKRELGAKVEKPFADLYEKYSRKEMDKAEEEVKAFAGEYDKSPEGRIAAEEALKNFSPAGKELVEEWTRMARYMGDHSVSIGMQTQDANGSFRPMRKVEGRYFPRGLDPEFENAIHDPTGNPAAWRKVIEIMKEEGFGKSDAEVLAYFRKAGFSPESSNDFFGNLEKARTLKLPNRLYDRSAQALYRYMRSWATRTAQVENFGQALGKDKPEMFEKFKNETYDKKTQEYIQAVSDRVYGVTPRTFGHRLLNVLNSIATGTMLSNPVTGIANLIGGTIDNMHEFGVRNTLRGLSEIGSISKLAAAIKDARDIGVLREDLMGMAGDAEALGSNFAQKVSDFAGKALKYTGYNAVESFNRALGLASSKAFLREAAAAHTKDPSSKKAQAFVKFIESNGIDAAKLFAENGTGRETERFHRMAVNEGQGGYEINQVPPWIDSPMGRFLFKFQKWGSQQTRLFMRRAIGPAEEFIRSGGKSGSMVPVLRYFLLTGLAGLTLEQLRETLFGTPKRSASLEQFSKAATVDQAKAWSMAAQKIWNSWMLSGAGGLLSNYAQMVKDVGERSRFKNPLQPPGVASITNAGELLFRAIEQHELTAKDIDDYVTSQLSLYRTAKQAGGKLAAATGAPVLKNEQARQDQAWLSTMTRRFADSVGVEASRTSLGRVGKTELSPEKRDVLDALRIGDVPAAKAAVKAYLSEVPKERQDAALKSLSASVRASQPIRVGTAGEARKVLFLEFARKELPASDVARIRAIDQRYMSTAQRAGLLDPKPVSQKSLADTRVKLGLAKPSATPAKSPWWN